MEVFLDTANLDEIILYKDFINGVTTNPSIISKCKSDFEAIIKDICGLVAGPVSAEVTSSNYDDMLEEGKRLSKIHFNVCVKLPCTFDGLRVCGKLSESGIATNMTLCFSPSQAIFAAKNGATYVSPFIGRLDDVGDDGMRLIQEIREIFDAQQYDTKVLAASVRGVQHVIQAASIGVESITMPAKILQQCLEHPLTDKGIAIFAKDWENKKN